MIFLKKPFRTSIDKHIEEFKVAHVSVVLYCYLEFNSNSLILSCKLVKVIKKCQYCDFFQFNQAMKMKRLAH